jgi:hypothetical protein
VYWAEVIFQTSASFFKTNIARKLRGGGGLFSLIKIEEP